MAHRVIDISELWDGGPNVDDFPIEKNYNVFNIVNAHWSVLIKLYIPKFLTLVHAITQEHVHDFINPTHDHAHYVTQHTATH